MKSVDYRSAHGIEKSWIHCVATYFVPSLMKHDNNKLVVFT